MFNSVFWIVSTCHGMSSHLLLMHITSNSQNLMKKKVFGARGKINKHLCMSLSRKKERWLLMERKERGDVVTESPVKWDQHVSEIGALWTPAWGRGSLLGEVSTLSPACTVKTTAPSSQSQGHPSLPHSHRQQNNQRLSFLHLFNFYYYCNLILCTCS